MDGVTRWKIHGERVVDNTRRAKLSIADVELPNGVRFEQYVLRMPKSATVAVIRDGAVLVMWRHRFVIGRWVWELPGGYVDGVETDPAVAAAREVEEETGWRPEALEYLGSFQPMVGTIDSENLLYLARGAVHVGDPEDINEAERITWVPLADVPGIIDAGKIVGSSSVVALLKALKRR